MNDLINRKDLEKIIYDRLSLSKNYHFLTASIFLRDLFNIIEHMPSTNQWIPCSKRLPEEREWLGTKRFGTTISDEVYVTFENPKGERFCKHMSFQNGKLSRFDQSTIDAFYPEAKPIAWMPLPEPWEGEEE